MGVQSTNVKKSLKSVCATTDETLYALSLATTMMMNFKHKISTLSDIPNSEEKIQEVKVQYLMSRYVVSSFLGKANMEVIDLYIDSVESYKNPYKPLECLNNFFRERLAGSKSEDGISPALLGSVECANSSIASVSMLSLINGGFIEGYKRYRLLVKLNKGNSRRMRKIVKRNSRRAILGSFVATKINNRIGSRIVDSSYVKKNPFGSKLKLSSR